MIRNVISLASGLFFGFGLALSGMSDPKVVLSFLDVTGLWNPQLLFVMAGGLAVFSLAFHLFRSTSKPFFDINFHLPIKKELDRPLIFGAAIFGIGWGMAGICPGPALTHLFNLDPKLLAFIAMMALGMLAGRSAGSRYR